MKKLWKVTVNNWTWTAPKTIYTETRGDAEKHAAKYPAADRVQYAGKFTDENAARLIKISNPDTLYFDAHDEK